MRLPALPIAFTALAITAGPTVAQMQGMYRCPNGFQDTPCFAGSPARTLTTPRSTPAPPAEAQNLKGSAAVTARNDRCKALNAEEDQVIALQKIGGNLMTQERLRAQMKAVQKDQKAAQC